MLYTFAIYLRILLHVTYGDLLLKSSSRDRMQCSRSSAHKSSYYMLQTHRMRGREEAVQLEPTINNEGSEYTQFLMVIIIVVRLERRHNMLPTGIPAGGSLYHLFMHNYTHMHGGDGYTSE